MNHGGPVRVAVTGMHLGDNSQPGPGVVASLRAGLGDRLRVVALAYDALDSGLHAPDVADAGFLLPYPGAGVEGYAARLLEVHARAPFDVLIPCLDVELPVLQFLQPRLAAAGIATLLPTPAALQRSSKAELATLAAACGLATPTTERVVDLGGLAAAGQRLGHPFVLKGPFYEAVVVHSAAAAVAAFVELSARWGLPLLAQAFVAGEEYDVAALGDSTGRRLGAVAMRKTLLTRLGKAWGAVTVDDDELLDAATRVVQELRWAGGCELELLRAHGSGELHLIEVNPRFPAWIHLATVAGVNLPLGLLQLARGEPVPVFGAARAGVFYVRHAVQVFGDHHDLAALLATGERRRREVAGP